MFEVLAVGVARGQCIVYHRKVCCACDTLA